MKHYPNTIKLEEYIDSLTIWDKLKIYMEYFIIWNTPVYVTPGILLRKPNHLDVCLWNKYINPDYSLSHWVKGYKPQTFEDFIDKDKNTVRVYNHQDNFSCIKYEGIYDFVVRFDKFQF